jgi:hypothetical protein
MIKGLEELKKLRNLDVLFSPGTYRAVGGTVRGALSRIAPAAEEVVQSNIARDMPEIVSRTLAGGQSYDPVAGRFIETLYGDLPRRQQDAGYIMAPEVELPGARTAIEGLDDADREQAAFEAFARIAQDPEVVSRLQRGELLGSWVNDAETELVIDPSRRYFTKGGSIAAGKRSVQEAGFAPRSGSYQVFELDPVTKKIAIDPVTGMPKLTPEAEASLRNYRRAQIAALGTMAGGTAGVLNQGE